MKCSCGNPMRQHIVALNDIWWICVICGRQKPAENEPVSVRPEAVQKGACQAVRQSAAKPAQPVPAKNRTVRNNPARSARPTGKRDGTPLAPQHRGGRAMK
jgi:hypothetical protein